MISIDTSGPRVFSQVRGKTATLHDGTTITGDVLSARPGRFPDADFWFLDEIIRDADGRLHRCRLRSDSVIYSIFERAPRTLKPVIIRFATEADAQLAADKITRVATAYEEGRIQIPSEPKDRGAYTFMLSIDGENSPPQPNEDLSTAIMSAEEAVAVGAADIRVSIGVTPGIVPRIPLGRFIDHDAMKAWTKANLRVGMWLVLQETQGGLITYTPAQVTSLPSKNGRFDVRLSPKTYAGMSGFGRFTVSGKSHDEPTGQSRLLPPTREALDLAAMGGAWDSPRTHRDGLMVPVPEEETLAALRAQPAVAWTYTRSGVTVSETSGSKSTAQALGKRTSSIRPSEDTRSLEGTDTSAAEEEGSEQSEIATPSPGAELRGGKEHARWAPGILNPHSPSKSLISLS